jgi:hypothetical protein
MHCSLIKEISVADPDPVSGIRCFFTPASGIRIRDPGWKKIWIRMNIPDHISYIFETIFLLKIVKFFDGDTESGIFYTLDPGWKNSDPGSEIDIPDPQH